MTPVLSMMDSDENYPSNATFEPAINKQHINCTPEQYLPHDFIVYGQPACLPCSGVGECVILNLF